MFVICSGSFCLVGFCLNFPIRITRLKSPSFKMKLSLCNRIMRCDHYNGWRSGDSQTDTRRATFLPKGCGHPSPAMPAVSSHSLSSRTPRTLHQQLPEQFNPRLSPESDCPTRVFYRTDPCVCDCVFCMEALLKRDCFLWLWMKQDRSTAGQSGVIFYIVTGLCSSELTCPSSEVPAVTRIFRWGR